VSIEATETRVPVLDGTLILAEHPRSYAQGEQIEDPSHIEELVAFKRRARQHRAQDRLAKAVPASLELLQQAAQRGTPLPRLSAQLLQLLDDYGATELEHAIAEALLHGVPHPNAVRQVLERRREPRDQPPPLAVVLPDNDKARNMSVRPASLALYDQIGTDHDTPHTDAEAPTDDTTP
jgi:hypothetical protein